MSNDIIFGAGGSGIYFPPISLGVIHIYSLREKSLPLKSNLFPLPVGLNVNNLRRNRRQRTHPHPIPGGGECVIDNEDVT